jgi:hypothetical protein
VGCQQCLVNTPKITRKADDEIVSLPDKPAAAKKSLKHCEKQPTKPKSRKPKFSCAICGCRLDGRKKRKYVFCKICMMHVCDECKDGMVNNKCDQCHAQERIEAEAESQCSVSIMNDAGDIPMLNPNAVLEIMNDKSDFSNADVPEIEVHLNDSD